MSTAPETASNQPATQPKETKDKRSIYNDTALHVIKGAIVQALGPSAAITKSVKFEHALKGSLTIEWPSNETISQELINQIETNANQIIQSNIEVIEKTMDRAEAEKYYTANPVNHTYIYDSFPVPASVNPLNLCLIPDININCCKGPHCKTTNELQALKILKAKKSKNKDKEGEALYEFLFSTGKDAVKAFEDRANQPSNKPVAAKAAASPSPTNQSVNPSNAQTALTAATNAMPAFKSWTPGSRSRVQVVSESVISLVQATLKQQQLDLPEKTINQLANDIERQLLLFGNSQYTAGFEAAANGSHLKIQSDRARVL